MRIRIQVTRSCQCWLTAAAAYVTLGPGERYNIRTSAAMGLSLIALRASRRQGETHVVKSVLCLLCSLTRLRCPVACSPSHPMARLVMATIILASLLCASCTAAPASAKDSDLWWQYKAYTDDAASASRQPVSSPRKLGLTPQMFGDHPVVLEARQEPFHPAPAQPETWRLGLIVAKLSAAKHSRSARHKTAVLRPLS